jgi:hypothetical protein
VSARAFLRMWAAFALVVLTMVTVVSCRTSLSTRRDGLSLVSVWRGGQLVARAELHEGDAIPEALAVALLQGGGTLVRERVVADAPVWTEPDLLFAMSFVPGRDGAMATLDGKTAYVTPDDLLARRIYDHGVPLKGLDLAFGLDVEAMMWLLGQRLGVPSDDVWNRAAIRRVRFERRIDGAPSVPPVTAETLTRARADQAAIEAARYLARSVGEDGRFRFLVEATTNTVVPQFGWPRHAGATGFLVQAAVATGDESLRKAALRAAGLLRTSLVDCGDDLCVGDTNVVELGGSALALLAFDELVRNHVDDSFRTEVVVLARFLRRMQRPDGEFMHRYDRALRTPLDVQLQYYSGEAALALARAYEVTRDPLDLGAASRALSRQVSSAARFFGDRYWYGEAHWECQALEALWDEAPDREALAFCLRWSAFQRTISQHAGDGELDLDGAIGLGPLPTPRLPMIAGRTEGVRATLQVAGKAGVDAAELDALSWQVRRALALMIRHQLPGELGHLLADPGAMQGAIPGSPVDLQVRVDFVQHAGHALLGFNPYTRAPESGP